MRRSTLRRTGALIVSAGLLASLTVATVAAPVSAAKQVTCQGVVATIVGTKKSERIVGTNGPDVIAGLGGNDVIIGRGGNDIICGGPGADRLVGKAGLDRLYGNAGPDKLLGGDGPDRLFGGVGNDLVAGQVGNDHLNGGPGTDRCTQGQGSGVEVSCEPWLLPLTGILAIAYSDIDGLDGYSSGDVMIAMLADTDGDHVPSIGDTIKMGRYPVNLDATAFGDWGVKSHVVASVETIDDVSITVRDAGDASFGWFWEPGSREFYEEKYGVTRTVLQDGFSVYPDGIEANGGSPSEPQTAVPLTNPTRYVDDEFIDVTLN